MPQRQGSPVDALALQSRPWEQKERTGSLEEDLHGTTGGVRQKQVSEVVWVVPSLMLAVEPPEGVGFKVPWSLCSNVAWSFLALVKKEKKDHHRDSWDLIILYHALIQWKGDHDI